MIPEAEIKSTAARLGVEAMVVDLDYVLGCFLATLFRHPASSDLAFKGGTCLKKCYYSDFRFSQDLDFTLIRSMRRGQIEDLLDAVAAKALDEWEIDFRARPIWVEVVDDEYGKESYQVRLYYHSPILGRRRDPRSIQLDLTTSETIAFPLGPRAILHDYSDAGMLSDVRVPCYDLLEMAAEKIRALSGQRIHAISRDIYDLHELPRRHEIDLPRLTAALPGKWKVKGLALEPPSIERFDSRREEFREDWEDNLKNLLPNTARTSFEAAWDGARSFLTEIGRAWPKPKT